MAEDNGCVDDSGVEGVTGRSVCSIIVGRDNGDDVDKSGELERGSNEEPTFDGQGDGCKPLGLGGSVGRRLARNHILSLTEATRPILLLSKSTGVEGQDKAPGMMQLDESSTGRINFGKVRNLPELSAKKLHSWRRQKQRTKRRGFHREGTWSTI